MLIGVLGFFSNPIVGHMGFFHADTMHNIVHIVLGLVLLMAAGSDAKASRWLKIVGVVYLLVAVLGFMMTPAMGEAKLLGLVEVNGADNWLHAVLGIVLFFAGMAGKKDMGASGAQM